MLSMNAYDCSSSRTIGITYPNNPNVYQMKEFDMSDEDAFKETMRRIKPESLHMDFMSNQYAKNMGYYHSSREKKELVFDIDLTDFRRFCGCDGKKEMCPICWLHIEGSVLMLDHFLQDSLQYREKNILWVFSGGKGIHCIVNNIVAINLSERERVRLHESISIREEDDTTLIQYIAMKCVSHPEFIKSLVDHFLSQVIRKRDLLTNSKFESFCLTRLMSAFPVFASVLKKSWTNYDAGCMNKKCRTIEVSNRSEKKWCILERVESDMDCKIRPSHFIIVRLFYPVIDFGPLSMHHKFKLPFSIHGRTKNISLPVKKETLLSSTFMENPLTLSKMLERRDPEMELFANAVDILDKWVENYNK